MKRDKFSCLSFSCFAQASTAALITLILVGASRADTIKKFFVEGTASNASGQMLGTCVTGATCEFSGTMMVDVTSSQEFRAGTVSAYDITFQALGAIR